ncbi:hypothetical protein, partial [Streptomyces decoyicus]
AAKGSQQHTQQAPQATGQSADAEPPNVGHSCVPAREPAEPVTSDPAEWEEFKRTADIQTSWVPGQTTLTALEARPAADRS